jgi:uncharacterized membrane protein
MRRNWDLLVLVGLAIVQIGFAQLPFDFGIARVALGIPFVLFAPGYALTAAARPDARGDRAESVVLALGLSFVIAVLGGLLLNLTPAGLTRETWIALLGVVTILGALVAAARRNSETRLWLPLPGIRGALVALVVGGLTIAAYQVAASGAIHEDQSQGFSQLWILSPDGAPNATGAVQVGLRNLEVAQTTYHVQVLADGNVAIDDSAVTLAPGETWQSTLPAATAAGHEVEAVVYRGADDAPYRRVRLAAPDGVANQEDGYQ